MIGLSRYRFSKIFSSILLIPESQDKCPLGLNPYHIMYALFGIHLIHLTHAIIFIEFVNQIEKEN